LTEPHQAIHIKISSARNFLAPRATGATKMFLAPVLWADSMKIFSPLTLSTPIAAASYNMPRVIWILQGRVMIIAGAR